MLVKIIVLFLVAMAVLAMFGRLRLPRRTGRSGLPPKPRKCAACGAPVIGRGPCPCGG